MNMNIIFFKISNLQGVCLCRNSANSYNIAGIQLFPPWKIGSYSSRVCLRRRALAEGLGSRGYMRGFSKKP